MHSSPAQTLWPTRAPWRHAVLILGGSAALAILSQIEVPLPFVPVTLQTMGVVLIGFLYGARLGAATLLAYLAEGALGLPVFAGGGGGVGYMDGPTGGYLVGFVLSAWLVGFLSERFGARWWVALPAALAGGAVVYVPGLLWLGQFLPDWQATLAAGLFPFVVGDLIKMALAAALYLGARGALARYRS